MDRFSWKNPDDFKLVMRCMKKRYVQDFITKGQIKLNTPRSWVEYAQKHGDGRGDMLEGTFAAMNSADLLHLKQIYDRYSINGDTVLPMTLDGVTYFKRASSINLPAYCMYAIKNSLLPCPGAGWHDVEFSLGASYFRDFTDNMPKTEYDALPENEKQSLVVINDFAEFKTKLIRALMNLGAKENEIICEIVKYQNIKPLNFAGGYDMQIESPGELFRKDIRYKEQNELRFVVNTHDPDTLRRITESTIEIGSLEGIATETMGYPYDGVTIQERIHVVQES